MLNSLITRINKNTFLKNVLWIAGGTAIAQAITILSTPIITRLYTPADFGIFTVFAAFVGIVGQLSTMRYSVTIPLADSEDLAESILKLCFLITFLLSLLLWFTTLLFGDYFTAKTSIPQAKPYLWLIPLCVLGAGLYEALSSWAQRRKYFKVIARTSLSQGISSAGIKIGLGWLGIKPFGLLLGLFASQVAGSGSLLIKLIKEKPSFFNKISWDKIADAAKRYSRFPLYQSWSRLLLALGAQLPVILMASFFGVKAAGLFGLAHSMINMPMNLIGTSVSQVYYVEIAQYGKSRPDKILSLSILIIKKMFFIGIIPMGIIILAGPWIFSLVFGAQWCDAGSYARLLVIIILTSFISTPIGHCFDVLEMQGTQLFINIIRVSLIVIVFIASKTMNLSSFETTNIYSISISLFYSGTMGIVFFSLKNKMRFCG